MTPLILASKSEARAAMLTGAGVPFETRPAGVDEDAVKASMGAEGAPARDIADMLAALKAQRVAAGAPPGTLVLGCDQVLVCEGVLFDKPASRAAARDQLSALRGQSHQLLSAAVIVRDGAEIWRHTGAARLSMRPFSDAFLDEYLDRCGDDVLSSVGAYRIEALGAQLFAKVTGDYFVILGMPLLEVLGFLRARGVLGE